MTAAAARQKRPSIKSRVIARASIILILSGVASFVLTAYGRSCTRGAGCECCVSRFPWSSPACRLLDAEQTVCDPAVQAAAVNHAENLPFDPSIFAALWGAFAVTLVLTYCIVFVVRFLATGGKLT